MSTTPTEWISSNFVQRNFPTNNVNIHDTLTKMYIYLNMPGVKPDSVDIEIYNNSIFVTGERLCELDESNYIDILSEYEYGQISKRIDIPICISSRESVTVKLELGVLCITIDKRIEERNIFTMRIQNGNEEDDDEDEDEDDGSVS